MFAFINSRVVSFLFLLIAVCYGQFKDGKEAEKPYIDYLTLDYLSVEQSLWSRLNHQGDKNGFFSLVQSEHLRFISSDFGVTPNTQDFVPSGYLANNLSLVNTLFYNASVILRSNSFDSIDIYYVHDILANSIAASESIFREAIRAEFWHKGKDYVQHCRHLESSPITVESEFQLIYNYYKDVRAALLKTYILTQLSHMLININNKGNNFSSTSYYVKDELFRRVDLIKRNVKNLLKIAKRDSWVCDRFPYFHVDDYTQVTNFLQGYIDNELNLSEEDTCQNNCEDFTLTRHVRCADKTLCAENRRNELVVCNGVIRNCKEIPSERIEVCYNADNPNRRYNYFMDSDGKVYGSKPETSECSSVNYANSWRRWFVKCSSCYCLCDDPKDSERHFSLHEVVSDIEQNKVVTGVRLVKENGVLQLSISQRTLLPFGQTEETEQDSWKLSDYQFAATDHSAIDGVDFFTLTYENRSINLDDLVVPQGKLVTGIRFFNLNGHLTLQIRATDFDYFSGRLENITHTPWVMNENGGQTEIEIPKKSNSLATVVSGLYIPDTTPNAFIRFGPSDIDFDAGQTTVPLIDTIPIESRNPVALGGIGITYKKNEESGGFIGLKTITYDFAIADVTLDEEYDYID